MRRFLYFFPGVTGANARFLSDRGLIDRFTTAGGGLTEHVVSLGTEGPKGSGCFVAAGGQPIQYRPERQRWVEGLQYWVGLEDLDLPPQPEDVAREVFVIGYDVTAENGTTWHAPLIRRFDPDTLQHVPNVPTSMKSVIQGGKRHFVRSIDTGYEKADEIAGRMFEAFFAVTKVAADELFEDALALLSLNYKIGIEEAELLGILEPSFAIEVVKASFDCRTFDALPQEMKINGLALAPEKTPQVEE